MMIARMDPEHPPSDPSTSTYMVMDAGVDGKVDVQPPISTNLHTAQKAQTI
jgi:hypothetical protein